jgi:hypothetical protein
MAQTAATLALMHPGDAAFQPRSESLAMDAIAADSDSYSSLDSLTMHMVRFMVSRKFTDISSRRLCSVV